MKVSKNGKSQSEDVWKRQNFRKQAASEWLRVHKPDIFELIVKESFKRYPGYKRGGRPLKVNYLFVKDLSK